MTHRKNALITGAAQGIGNTIATKLAEIGDTVLIADVNAEAAKAASQALVSRGLSAIPVALDVSNQQQVSQTLHHVSDEVGSIDILVNNAGIISNTHWSHTTPQEWERVLAVNLSGTMYVTQAVLPAMCEQRWGRIINIVSLAGRTGGVSVGPAYAASKAGIIGLTRHLAGKCAAYGVTVNAVAPGTTRTPMIDAFTDEQMEDIYRTIPVGRLGEAHEIAAAVAYLASNDAGFTTGVTLDVNGGMYFG